MRLSGNSILITGATSGIGLGLLDFFYKNGNEIIAVGRDFNKILNLQEKYPTVHFKSCDLSKEVEVLELIEFCNENYKKINVIINNAGIELNYLFTEDIDSKCISDEIQTNLLSPILLINGLKGLLFNQPKAAIVNISSALIYYPKINAAVYSATKAGLHHYSIALREQLKDTSIKVFEVIPPLVDTPLTKSNPHKKISVDQLVQEFANAFEKDETTIHIAYSKWVEYLYRMTPSVLKFLILRRYKKSHV